MMTKIYNKKIALTVISVIIVLVAFTGATLAFLIDSTNAVTNIFIPAKVQVSVQEDFTEGETIKRNVNFINEGDTSAFVRVAVVINWQNSAGEVYSSLPKEGIDYDIDINKVNWILADDGYYYLLNEVPTGEETPVFINSLEVLDVGPLDEYTLSVDVLATAIQSRPDSAVYDAWGLSASDGVLIVE